MERPKPDPRVVAYLQGHDATCPQCSYQLRGLKDHQCPECGGTFVLEDIRQTGGLTRSDRNWLGWYLLLLAGVNVCLVIRMWGHPPATSFWSWLVTGSRRRGGSGISLMTILNGLALMKTWELDESESMGLRTSHMVAIATLLTAAYALIVLVAI